MSSETSDIESAKTATDIELAKVIDYSEKLLGAAIDVVGAARVELDQSWARNPKIVGLTILCRSISNFRASIRLAQQEQVLEAKVLVRLMFENLLWLAALRERGAEFVQDMIKDEAFNRKALGELTLKIITKSGADASGPDALNLQSIIRELGQKFPKTKTLQAAKTAAGGAIEEVYIEYRRLSLDAVHCSITALGHHLWTEQANIAIDLVLSVVPRTSSADVLSTILQACRALMGASIVANELLGFTITTAALEALTTEFESNGWQHGI